MQKKQPAAGNRKGPRASQAKSGRPAGRPAGRPFKKDHPRTVKEKRSSPSRPEGRPFKEDRPRSGNPTGRPFKRDQPRTGRPTTRTDQDDRPRSGRPAGRPVKEERSRPSRPEGRPFKEDRPRSGNPTGRPFIRDQPRTGRPTTRADQEDRPRTGRTAGRPVKEERSRPNRPEGVPFKEDRPRSGNPTGRPFKRDQPRTGRPTKRADQDDRPRTGRPWQRTEKPYPGKKAGASSYRKSDTAYDESIRLNRYVANAGVCSRREADVLITAGAISVNGTVVTEMGTKVMPGDVVKYGDRRLNNEKKVYLLLNKPKDFITTTDDPQERKTVFDLIQSACKERIYPVGRLDRNTTGVLLFTNDGELTKKLTHPKHGVRKLYHVHIDKALTKADMLDIMKGIQLDGSLVVPDKLEFAGTANNKKEIGIEIHSGQNRVVRRIFEHFGYRVEKLDRVVFAGLTKKDLPRGKWRFLSEKEVNFLKMLG